MNTDELIKACAETFKKLEFFLEYIYIYIYIYIYTLTTLFVIVS